MSNNNLCPLEVYSLELEKKDVSADSYQLKADFDCIGLCNRAQGIKGRAKHDNLIINNSDSLTGNEEEFFHVTMSAAKLTKLVVRVEYGCPFYDLSVLEGKN